MKQARIDIDGFFLLDKPKGISSNSALKRVQRLLLANKAGHTGSLDPLATGMLPICLGQATKFAQFLLSSDKQYVVTAHLGIITNTGDADGEVIATQVVDPFSIEKIESVLDAFRGDIQQVPPMYSALKHKGQRLYRLARQGIVVDRPARPVSIYQLELVNYQHPSIELRVHCSKGTYIRSLVEDIGHALLCGAYVSQLRREWVSPYNDHAMISLTDLECMAQVECQRAVLPMSSGLAQYPVLQLSKVQTRDVLHGRRICIHPVSDLCVGSLVCLQGADGQFLGVAECDSQGAIKTRRLINTALTI